MRFMKRKTAILLGVFSFLSLIEIYIAFYNFIALDIPRFLIYGGVTVYDGTIINKNYYSGFYFLFNSVNYHR